MNKSQNAPRREKNLSQEYILHDSIYMKFQNIQNNSWWEQLKTIIPVSVEDYGEPPE